MTFVRKICTFNVDEIDYRHTLKSYDDMCVPLQTFFLSLVKIIINLKGPI